MYYECVTSGDRNKNWKGMTMVMQLHSRLLSLELLTITVVRCDDADALLMLLLLFMMLMMICVSTACRHPQGTVCIWTNCQNHKLTVTFCNWRVGRGGAGIILFSYALNHFLVKVFFFASHHKICLLNVNVYTANYAIIKFIIIVILLRLVCCILHHRAPHPLEQ